MTNYFNSRIILVSIIIIIALAISVVGIDSDNIDNDVRDWTKATPSEIHQEMWNHRVKALEKYFEHQEAQKLEKVSFGQVNYDMKFYDINIRVDDTTEILYGVVKFVAEATENGVATVDVDFYDNMTIDSMVVSGGQLSYTRSNNVVTITLDQTYNETEQFEFDFYYHGHPIEGGLQAFSFNLRYGYKVMASLSEPYSARTWWPCKDRMDDKADSFNIAVTIDTLYYCGSNGTLDSVVADGSNVHTFYYRVRNPMVTYLFSLAISKYTVWEDEWVYNGGLDTMPIVHAVYPDRYTYSLDKYDVTPQALSVYSSQYGLYPFSNEKYGHANFEWGGGMEHQTMTSMTGGSFGFSEPVIIHELAHQWFGDYITCNNWSDIWLNEGWASYSEALFYQVTEGWESYHSYMGGMRYTNGGTIYISDTTDVWNIFGLIVYDKGAWVCHMLRGILGDSLFFEGINAYYNSQYKNASATTEQFRDVFENASGMELDWFFEDWIYGEFYPNYRFSYWTEPSDISGYEAYVYVRQSQYSEPNTFRMPIDFNFNYSDATNDTMVFFNDQRRQLFKSNHPESINSIEMDPSEWILRNAFQETWTMHIITFDGELKDGEQAEPYLDTIEARGNGGLYSYEVTSGSLPDGIVLDFNTGILSGTSYETGDFNFGVFVNETSTVYKDSLDYNITLVPYSSGIPGDFDISGDVGIADVTGLVDYLFQQGPPPLILNLADADGSCEIGISDLTALVDYLFNGGAAPLMGCVS